MGLLRSAGGLFLAGPRLSPEQAKRAGKPSLQRSFGLIAWVIVAVTAAGPIASAQRLIDIPPRTLTRETMMIRATFRVDARTVLLPVRVTDIRDYPVTDLSSNSFRVFEDNIEQSVISLHKEDGPVSVGLIFDGSGSMKDRIACSVEAIGEFLRTLVTGDEYFLIAFNERPLIVTRFMENPAEILSSLSQIKPDGPTALNDAVYLGVHEMERAKNPRKALFVLTDGGDNSSSYSNSEVRTLVREADVRIYSIGLFDRQKFLAKLASDSGGRAFRVRKLNELPSVIETLSLQFRNEYVLSYAPKEQAKDGKYRRVRVQISETSFQIPLNVFWRHGYYAPE